MMSFLFGPKDKRTTYEKARDQVGRFNQKQREIYFDFQGQGDQQYSSKGETNDRSRD